MSPTYNRVVVYLYPEEAEAFTAMIAQDTRSPRDQVRHLVVQEAYRRGLLSPPTPTGRKAKEIGSVESRGKFAHAANGPAQPPHGTKTPRG